MFSSETPSGQSSVGIDASHRGDSSQHTAPLPAPAVLPSDTPIAPTPEQVNKPGPESRVPGHPRTSEDGRGGGGGAGGLPVRPPRSLRSVLTAAPQVCASCLGDEAQRGTLTCPEPHSSLDSAGIQAQVSYSKQAPSCTSAARQPRSPWSTSGSTRQRRCAAGGLSNHGCSTF